MANRMLGSPLSERQREVDQRFERFENFFSTSDGNGLSGFAPAVDLWETDDHYVFAFDLPGLTKQDVNITYLDGMLQISGQWKWTQDENLTYQRVERTHSWMRGRREPCRILLCSSHSHHIRRRWPSWFRTAATFHRISPCKPSTYRSLRLREPGRSPLARP